LALFSALMGRIFISVKQKSSSAWNGIKDSVDQQNLKAHGNFNQLNGIIQQILNIFLSKMVTFTFKKKIAHQCSKNFGQEITKSHSW
jgi:hypothetical protein